MPDPTPRGYPTFDGNSPPAGHIQMGQLAGAIDADVTALEEAVNGRERIWQSTQSVTAPATSGGWLAYPPELVARLGGVVPSPTVGLADNNVTVSSVQPRASSRTANGVEIIFRTWSGAAVATTAIVSYTIAYVDVTL